MRPRLTPWMCLMVALCMGQASAAEVPPTQRSYYFVSDLHLGVGRVLPQRFANQEDFRWHDDLVAWLNHIDTETSSSAELVLLGDSFELWQSPFQTCEGDGSTFSCKARDCQPEKNGSGHSCSESEALARIKNVLAQHKPTIDALAAFARRGNNHLTIVPGNHDAAILLPKVKAAVLEAMNDVAAPRVTISSVGFWKSDDGRIYGDHGHMYDKVNKFAKWPEPYDVGADGPMMLQPWGENMVQRFYNQYEELLPAIDNVADETAGARLAADALGQDAVRVAARRFLGFLAFDTTLRQKLSFLGQQEQGGDDLNLGQAQAGSIPWDYAAIRSGDAATFALESMPLDSLRAAAQQAGAIEIAWSDFSDEDIATLCEQRKVLIDYYSAKPQEKVPADGAISVCPLKKDANASLGWVADQVFGLSERNRRNYLDAVGTALHGQFDVYVYGHTHSAVAPATLKIRSFWSARVVNDGAFQRLASIDQLNKLAAKKGLPTATLFAQLTPENLPPCYSYVRVKPYATGHKPTPELRWWALANGQWQERDSCPDWP